MGIDDETRDEKLQYDINRKVAKISALTSEKIDKYSYLTCEETSPFNQRQIVEQAKFAYSPSGKASEKQTQKQVADLKSLDTSNKENELKNTKVIFPQNDLIRFKLKEIANLKDIIEKDNLNYKSKQGKICNFGKYSLPTEIYANDIYHYSKREATFESAFQPAPGPTSETTKVTKSI